MIVRLLPKSEVDKRKAEEQHQSLQEGLKVAERVDLLRETLASETAAFEKYRTDSLRAIQGEIALQEAKKQALEEQNKTLVPPPSHSEEEIRELEEMAQKAKEREEQLSIESASLSEKSVTLTVREQEAKKLEDKSKDMQRLASSMFAEAEAKLSQAKEEVAGMRNKAQAELSLIEIQQVELSKKAASLALTEQEVNDKKQRIEKYEQNLMKRELALREGWKNLEQTTQRLNK